MNEKLSKRKIGMELMDLVKKEKSIVDISHWADDMYSNYCRELDFELDEIISKISCMQLGAEFELSKDQLLKIADNLICDWEKMELSNSIPEIHEIANGLEGYWLMCPLCQEAWENPHPEYCMVICPKCNRKLHNPLKMT